MRSATTWASVAGGARRRHAEPRARATAGGGRGAPRRDGPADRPRSRRRPAAPTSSDPAISTGWVSGTGRPEPHGSPGGVDEEGDAELQPERGGRRRTRGRRASCRRRRPGAARRRTARSCPGRGASSAAASTALSAWSSRSLVAKSAPADRRRRRRRPRRCATTNAKSRLPRHDECACAGVVALAPAPPSTSSTPSSASIVQMPRPTASSVDGGAGEHLGRERRRGVGDHEGAAGPRPGRAPRSVCVLVEAVVQHEGDVVVGVGKPDGELDVGAELLEQRHERAGAVGLVGPRVERRAVVRASPGAGGRRAARRRWRRRRACRATAPSDPHRQHAGLELAEALGLRRAR